MAGGGTSPGAMTEYPKYQMETHSQWLDGDKTTDSAAGISLNTNLNEIMNTLLSQVYTPYYGEEAFDPSDDLTNWEENIQEFYSLISSLDRDTEFTDVNTLALSTAESNYDVPDDISYIKSLEAAMVDAITAALSPTMETIIQNAVADYQAQSEIRVSSAVSKFSAGMADINAVHSSAFVIGRAMIETENLKDVNSYDMKIRLQIFSETLSQAIKTHLTVVLSRESTRDSFVLSAIGELNRLGLTFLEKSFQTLGIFGEYYKLSIISQKEYQREQLEIDVNNAMWDLKVMQNGANVLGAVSGSGVPVSQEMNPTQSAISGLASGAAMGAVIGGSTGIGAPMGAISGAVLGLIGGLLR